MNKLILYTDQEGDEMVMLCTEEDFYKAVFKDKDDTVEINEEIDIDDDLIAWPTNRPLTANF